MKENVSHVDTCSAELFKKWIFEDSKMAQILGVKVNLSWSILNKLMHDKWNKYHVLV
jgi:transcription initiation factor IIE alpha subunit